LYRLSRRVALRCQPTSPGLGVAIGREYLKTIQ
jgi:hypothetical protein